MITIKFTQDQIDLLRELVSSCQDLLNYGDEVELPKDTQGPINDLSEHLADSCFIQSFPKD